MEPLQTIELKSVVVVIWNLGIYMDPSLVSTILQGTPPCESAEGNVADRRCALYHPPEASLVPYKGSEKNPTTRRTWDELCGVDAERSVPLVTLTWGNQQPFAISASPGIYGGR